MDHEVGDIAAAVGEFVVTEEVPPGEPSAVVKKKKKKKKSKNDNDDSSSGEDSTGKQKKKKKKKKKKQKFGSSTDYYTTEAAGKYTLHPPPPERAEERDLPLRAIEIAFDAQSDTTPGVSRIEPDSNEEEEDEDSNHHVICFDLVGFTGRVTVRRVRNINVQQQGIGAVEASTGGSSAAAAQHDVSSGADVKDLDHVQQPQQQEQEQDHLNYNGRQMENGNKAQSHDDAMQMTDDGVMTNNQEESSQKHDPSDVSPSSSPWSVLQNAATAMGAGIVGGASSVKNTFRNRKNNIKVVPSGSAAASTLTATGADGNDATAASAVAPPPTALHELCAKHTVTLEELQQALAREPTAASVTDAAGCLPLHILGSNEFLVGHEEGKKAASAFCWELMLAFPSGITSLDKQGRMPFVQVIEDWIRFVYETHQRSKEWSSNNGSSKNKNPDSSGGGSHASRTSTSFNSFLSGVSSTIRTVTTTAKLDGTREGLIKYAVEACPPASVYDEVEWCFAMLSLALDGLGGRDGGLFGDEQRKYHLHQSKDQKLRTELCAHLVERMPMLLKTVLLIEDDGKDSRERILGMSVMRRLLLIPATVGPWMARMLQRRGTPAHRAIDYMTQLSRVTVQDYVGTFRDVHSRDRDAFEQERLAVFEAVARLEETIVSLLVLGDEDQERAVSVSLTWHVMKHKLLRPFIVSLVLVDFVLHVVVLLAARTVLGLSPGNPDLAVFVIFFTGTHYVIRKFCESAAIFSMSTIVFRSYILNLWTLIDLFTVALIMTLVVKDVRPEAMPIWFSLVIGLLWLKILSFLKVVNRAMATFIITLLKITRDLRFFALVLICIILMFSDMFHLVVRYEDDGNFCTDHADGLSDPTVDFCSTDQGDAILRVYALLLGDFELNDYRDTPGMLFLFIVFSIMGVLVLLNLLIALMSTSYEEAMERSLLLFGRARISFVAESSALERFLRPKSLNVDIDHSWCCLDVIWRLIRWVFLMSLLASSVMAEVYLVFKVFDVGTAGTAVYLKIILIVILFIVLTWYNLVLTMYSLEFWFKGCAPGFVRRVTVVLGRCVRVVNNAVAIRLFGLDSTEGIEALDGHDK